MSATRPIAALLAVLSGMALIGFVDNFVVVIAEEAGLWQFHLIRSLIALPLICGLWVIGMGRLRPLNVWAVSIRSIFVAGSMILYFGTLAFLPIAQVAAGLFTSPIFVLLISAFFLRVQVGPVRLFAALAGFAGVLMVLRPDAGGLGPANIVPVAAGLLYAIGAIVTRRWCAAESMLSMLTGFFLALGIFGSIGAALLALFPQVTGPGAAGFVLRGWAPATQTFLFWTVVQAVGSIVAVGLLIKGYQWADASYVAVFEYSLLIWVSLWAFVLRGETVDRIAFLGIALIILSGAVIAMRSRMAAEALPVQ